MTALAHDAYHVGIICALKIELAAMRAMLDEEHGRLDAQNPSDHNVYFAGSIHKHKVVIACLPAGIDGVAAAASVVKDMVRTFTQLRFGLLVGIGGGIPDLENGVDIRLGDVVVSQPRGVNGGVIQYDKGKRSSGSSWERKGSLNAPPTFLLTALASLQAEHELSSSQIPAYLVQMTAARPKMLELGYGYPGAEMDVFDTLDNLRSPGSRKRKRLTREDRPNKDPVIHYGVIASGNTVVKDAFSRDSLRNEFGALCVEMEAAGLMNEIPSLVIRGISDYAGEHKNDIWHRYAATTAAAFAKELLLHVSTRHVTAEPAIEQVLDTIRTQSKSTVDFIRSQEEQKLYQNCHQAFYTSTYAEYKELNRRAVPGTCQWLLKHQKFIEWYQSPGNTLLWVSADPGCGKSVLSRHLVDIVLSGATRSIAARYVPHTICYFFFKDNSNQDSLSTALSAVLHQIFLQQPELIRSAIPAYKSSGHQLSGDAGQLWAIMQNAAKDTNAKSIVCVLDGLDECRVSDRKRLIEFLCRFYDTRARITPDANRTLKFLVTSRPYDDIQSAFGHVPADLPSIRLRGEDENDQIHDEIDLVIEDYMLDLSRELQLSPENTHRIKNKLFEMENRTYLWLYLVIDHIRSSFQRSLRPEREQIILLPRSVDEAYEQLLMRVQGDSVGAQVRVILSIILGSRRALSIYEMAIALDIATDSSGISSLRDFTIDPDRLRDNIRQWCGLFIFINHGYIYLLHQTAKEFLLRHSADDLSNTWHWKQSLYQLDVEELMATLCVVFLNVREFDDRILSYWMNTRDIWGNTRNGGITRQREIGSRHERFAAMKILRVSEACVESIISFFEYAARFWASHFRVTEQKVDVGTRQRSLELYNCTNLRFRRINYFTSTHKLEGDDYESHAILLAAFNGHCLALNHLLEQTPSHLDTFEVNSGKTALIIAAEQGHYHAVQAILSRGAIADIHFEHGKTALTVAAGQGHLSIVQTLLRQRPQAVPELSGAFMQALKQGYVPIVSLILDAGLNLNTNIDKWGLPLNPETSTDNALMTKLWEVGISLGEYNGWGTALHMAVWKGDASLVKDMISRGADYNARCQRTGSVLRTACLLRHEEIFQILWDKQAGVDVSTKSLTDIEAFQTAAVYCRPEIVQQFIERRVDVNKEGVGGQNALQTASMGGDEAVVRLLLRHGANVDARSATHGTALMAASEHGHENIVSILLSHDADITVDCGQRGTALHGAASRGHEAIVRLLLDAGLDANTPGGQYDTALQAASFHGHEKVVKLLLTEGAQVNQEGGESFTALHAAASQGHADVVAVLLDAGADATISQPSGYNAFTVAMTQEYEHIAALIAGAGFDPGELLAGMDIRESYEALLRVARSCGRFDLDMYLMDNIYEAVNDSDDDYRNSDWMSDDEYEQELRGWCTSDGYSPNWGANYALPYDDVYFSPSDRTPADLYFIDTQECPTPSDVFSVVEMPDNFDYRDSNPHWVGEDPPFVDPELLDFLLEKENEEEEEGQEEEEAVIEEEEEGLSPPSDLHFEISLPDDFVYDDGTQS